VCSFLDGFSRCWGNKTVQLNWWKWKQTASEVKIDMEETTLSHVPAATWTSTSLMPEFHSTNFVGDWVAFADNQDLPERDHGSTNRRRRWKRCLTSAKNIKNLLTNRPMPVRAPDDARPGTGRCFMSPTATGEKRCVFAEVHITFT